MQESPAVAAGLERFYDAFNSGDADAFAAVIADLPGVSVVGTGPGEGHDDREDWIAAYRAEIAQLGLRLEGGSPRGWSAGAVGYARDEPAFVLPDGGRLPTRLTGVLVDDGGEWKVVHLHFSVGIPDEEAVEPG